MSCVKEIGPAEHVTSSNSVKEKLISEMPILIRQTNYLKLDQTLGLFCKFATVTADFDEDNDSTFLYCLVSYATTFCAFIGEV